MESNNEIELAAFEIISYSGSAKALFLEAVDLAIEHKFDAANEKIKEGKELLKQTHKAHSELIFKEAQGETTKMSLLLVHAEDQFMSCENALVLAEKMIKFIKNSK